jgi:MFS family permease
LSLAYLSEVYILLPFTDIVGQNDVVKIIYLEGSGLQESALVGFPLLFAFILIMTGFLFGILLLRYGIASSLPEIKIRGFFMGIGLMIFAFFSILDAAFNNTPENFIILVFARIMISFGLVLLTTGLIAPNFIKNKFTNS